VTAGDGREQETEEKEEASGADCAERFEKGNAVAEDGIERLVMRENEVESVNCPPAEAEDAKAKGETHGEKEEARPRRHGRIVYSEQPLAISRREKEKPHSENRRMGCPF
jgi:hypothetical protein